MNDKINKYRQILNIPNGVALTEKLIKDAYRFSAKIYHPDVQSDVNLSNKMIEVNEAYDWLLNNLEKIVKTNKAVSKKTVNNDVTVSKYIDNVKILFYEINSILSKDKAKQIKLNVFVTMITTILNEDFFTIVDNITDEKVRGIIENINLSIYLLKNSSKKTKIQRSNLIENIEIIREELKKLNIEI